MSTTFPCLWAATRHSLIAATFSNRCSVLLYSCPVVFIRGCIPVCESNTAPLRLARHLKSPQYLITIMKLTEKEIHRFQQDGYLVVEQLLSPDELRDLRERTEDIAAGRVDFPREKIEFEPGAPEEASSLTQVRKINDGANSDPVLGAHTRHRGILEVVESLLGPDIKLFGDQFFIKPPGGIEKTYHQDSPYFKIEPMNLVTAWAALEDVTLENGCLYVVPGSHLEGALDHSEPWMVGDRKDMKIPDSAIDRSKETPITLKAGDCSFHHSLTLHRSGPNNTPHFRRGYATHFMSSHSRWTGDPNEKPDYPLLLGAEFEGCV